MGSRFEDIRIPLPISEHVRNSRAFTGQLLRLALHLGVDRESPRIEEMTYNALGRTYGPENPTRSLFWRKSLQEIEDIPDEELLEIRFFTEDSRNILRRGLERLRPASGQPQEPHS